MPDLTDEEIARLMSLVLRFRDVPGPIIDEQPADIELAVKAKRMGLVVLTGDGGMWVRAAAARDWAAAPNRSRETFLALLAGRDVS